jgi:hypothetical protein
MCFLLVRCSSFFAHIVLVKLQDANQKEFLMKDWSMTRNPTIFEELADSSWAVVSGKGMLTPPDAEETLANRANFATLLRVSHNQIVYRRCASCDEESHKDVYYRRWTRVPVEVDLLDYLESNWINTKNVMDKDFSLYSTYDDAVADVNRWQYCNFGTDGAGIGFPRDCGPSTWTPWQWNSFTAESINNEEGQSDVAFFVEAQGPPTASPAPSIAAFMVPSVSPSVSMSPSAAPTPTPPYDYVTCPSTPTPGPDETPQTIDLAATDVAFATSSSECYGGSANKAIDGNGGTINHSCCSESPWWQVDLGKCSKNWIDMVEIDNRADCCGGRLKFFYVHVLDADQNVVASKYYNGG